MFVAESKRLTHQGAKKIMATALELAGQANIAISCTIVDAGGHVILIERMERTGALQAIEDRRAVAAAPERRVDVDAVAMRVEPGERFVEHHRAV